jgi:hypothetical protein
MFEERAVQICTELIARRVVPREAMPDLLDEPLLQEEVKQRLADVGLEFVDKTGVAYVGVVIRDAYLAEELPNELGLDSRAMALILRCWLLLVAPHIYTGYQQPAAPSSMRSLLQTPVSGRSSSTRSAAARSPAIIAATERACS